MDHDEAFRVLGLKPLTIHMSERPREDVAGIGATTWMLVDAAVALMEGRSVTLLGNNVVHANAMFLACVNYHAELCRVLRHEDPHWVFQARRHARHGEVSLRAESHMTWRPSDTDGEIYEDEDWKARATRLAADPHIRVRFLKEVPGGFAGHDFEGHYILTVTTEIGEAMLRRFPTHILLVG